MNVKQTASYNCTYIMYVKRTICLHEQGTGDALYMGLIFRQNKKWNIAVPPPPLLCVATLTSAAVSLFAAPAIPT
jgi:hypothetical protein